MLRHAYWVRDVRGLLDSRGRMKLTPTAQAVVPGLSYNPTEPPRGEDTLPREAKPIEYSPNNFGTFLGGLAKSAVSAVVGRRYR